MEAGVGLHFHQADIGRRLKMEGDTRLLKSAYQRPCSSPHNCLCNCIWNRTGNRSARIHSASSRGVTWVKLG